MNYKDFDINTEVTEKPWGPREEQAWKDIVDTVVMDCIAQTKKVTGHKHNKLYSILGTIGLEIDTTGVAKIPSLTSGGVVTNTASGILETSVSLPIAKGGTNSTTALNNNRVIISSGGAIVESSVVSVSELNLLNGMVSVSVGGSGNDDKLVTQGYVDEIIMPAIVPIAKGGTNSDTALNNDRVIISSGGKIIESPQVTISELGLLNGMVSVTLGAINNDKLVTQGYVDDLATVANAFISLADTPSSYIGEGGKGVRVNSIPNGLEFYDIVDTDEKVAIDSGATAGYLGAAFSDGVLRASDPITYADGGDYITLGINESLINHENLTNKIHDGDTLQLDGINSDGGDFNFTTSGAVTFNKWVGIGEVSPDKVCHITEADIGVGNEVTFPLKIERTHSSCAVGIGVGIEFYCDLGYGGAGGPHYVGDFRWKPVGTNDAQFSIFVRRSDGINPKERILIDSSGRFGFQRSSDSYTMPALGNYGFHFFDSWIYADEIRESFKIRMITHLTPTTGFGAGISFELEDDSDNYDVAGMVGVRWDDATNGSEDAAFTWELMAGGSAKAEVMSLSSVGVLSIGGAIQLPNGTSINNIVAATAYTDSNDCVWTGANIIDYVTTQIATVNTFLELTDTPGDYTDDGGKGVRVNVGETALEFYTLVDTDEKVKVDSGATAGYLGAAPNDGVLQVSAPITYADGGDYITLGINESLIDHENLTNKIHDGDTLQLDGVNSDGGAFAFNTTGTLTFSNTITLTTCADAGTDTDKFLVLDGSNNIDYRTGAELIADIRPLAGTDVELAELGTATYDDVQDYVNFFGDRVALTGGSITAHGDADGSVIIAATTSWSKESNSDTAVGKFFNFTGTVKQTLTDLTTNIIYLDYNGGTPQTVVATDPLTYGFQQDHILLGVVFRNGNAVHIVDADRLGIQGINRVHMQKVEHGSHRSSGLVTTELANRELSMTSGVLHLGLIRKTINAIDTSGVGTFSYWYTSDSGATWSRDTGQTAITQNYNDITSGKVALGTSKYGVHWGYMDFDGHMHIVYGRGNYSANQAEEATVPSLMPNITTSFSVIIFKIINQEGSDTLIIEYPWTAVFVSSLATDHGSLGGLTGDDHTQYSLADGTRDYTGIVSYDAHKTFTVDAQIIDKKYADDLIAGSTNYAFKTITGITNDVVADSATDILTLASGNNILGIVGTAATDIVTFTIDETNIDHDNLNNFTSTEHFTMLDEDNMVSNSDTKAATQQSIVAYIAAQVLIENLWDRAGTVLSPHTAGDNVTTTGMITGNSFITSSDIGIITDTDLLQLTAVNTVLVNGTLQSTAIGCGIAPDATIIGKFYRDDASATPQLLIENDGLGDAALRLLVTDSGITYSMGIDNSYDDYLKLAPMAAFDNSVLSVSFCMIPTGEIGMGTTGNTLYQLNVNRVSTNQNGAAGAQFFTQHTTSVNGAYTNYGVLMHARNYGAANNTSFLESVHMEAINYGTGTLTGLRGGYFGYGTNAAGTTTNAYGAFAQIQYNEGTITNAYDYYCATPLLTGGTANKQWSFYSDHVAPSRLVDDLQIDANNKSILYGDDQDAGDTWNGDDLIRDFDLLNSGTSDYRIQEDGEDRLVILTGGNIGIGVSDPDTKLEVFYAGNQLKLSFDATDNCVLGVNTAGDLTIIPSGDDMFLANGTGLNLYEDITFLGATGENEIRFPDDLLNALIFAAGPNFDPYMIFETTINPVASQSIRMDVSLKLKEQSADIASTAGYGQFWVKDDTPCWPKYTSDTNEENWIALSDGGTGGTGPAGLGNQYVELNIGGTIYKVLHDGTI